MRRLAATLAVLFSLTAIAESPRPATAEEGLFAFSFQEVAEDVWVGVRPDSPRFPVMGNTTFVISDEGVVVFDGGGAPAMAEQVIEKIRSLTTQPVTHVVISHWHGDHNFGVYRFAEEFAGVQFVAHRFTSEVLDSPRASYIDDAASFREKQLKGIQSMIAAGEDRRGRAVEGSRLEIFERIVADADAIDAEYQRLRITPPTLIVDGNYTIQSGERRIELLHLGQANTEGDLAMWLPDERVVAAGDIVVSPTPYAFNVPPRAWAETLRALNRLDYRVLVPGHGPVQSDTSYVDLLIEAAQSIADQRDDLLASGMEGEELEAALDFSRFEERFTHGDPYIAEAYLAWFERPFRKAATKALTGGPMVEIDRPAVIPFDDERWQIEGAEATQLSYLGRSALKLQGGSAVLADLEIRNGLVEFDLAVGEDRGFAGLMFHLQDGSNYEHFYIRPHQSGMPDANQYTPVFNGISAWQLLHGDGYGTPVDYRFDEWMHVKVVFAGSRADVYIDSDEPVLRVTDLKRGDGTGLVGVSAADFAPAWFANFKVTELANAYVLPRDAKPAEAVPEGRVRAWQVSDPFDLGVLVESPLLTPEITESRQWTGVSTDESGIMNLAAVPADGMAGRTRFARLMIRSEAAQTKLLTLGYSDVARVFLNGSLLYVGDNTYRSRDYRYLGTIGLFDTVALRLDAGENEVLIAATEAFGGWGVLAEFGDLEGIQIGEAP